MNDVQAAIQLFAAINFLAVGASHVAQPRAWLRLFASLRQHEWGPLAVGLHGLAVGSLIISFHNVWSGIPIALTVVGWALVIKNGLYLLSPKLGQKGLRLADEHRTGRVIIAGAGLFLLGGALLAHRLVAG
jgi:hypothetical protein